MFTVEELRALGFPVPTDEEFAQKKAEVEAAAHAEKVAEADRQVQSLTDQLNAAREARAALDAQG